MKYKRVKYDITKEDILTGKYDNKTIKLIDPLWWKVDIYNGLKKYKDTSAGFTDAQIAVFAIIWLDCEVENRGYEQFFNSVGIVWKDALYGLKLMVQMNVH
ncbi:MAG: DMP19 family protein [Ruminococcus sp.]|nr:DMP19 family protein [Ruminococcus sp.]